MKIKELEDIAKKLKQSYDHFIHRFNSNDFLDRCTKNLKSRFNQKLEPLVLEPSETPFQYRSWFYTIKGVLNMTNTKLYQLFNIKRTGTPKIGYKNSSILLSWQMMFPEIKMTSDYAIEVFNANKKGQITAKVKNLLADVSLNCNFEEMKTRLNKLKLESKGNIDIELGGGEKIDAVASVLLKTVANVFKGTIIEKLEEAVKENIEEVLDNTHLIPER